LIEKQATEKQGFRRSELAIFDLKENKEVHIAQCGEDLRLVFHDLSAECFCVPEIEPHRDEDGNLVVVHRYFATA